MLAPVFALTPPEPRAKALPKKPGWWLAHVERETRAHRQRRAADLDRAAARRAEDALFVYEAIKEGQKDEAGIYPLAPFRGLPGASPEVLKRIRRWDTEIKNSSSGHKRLLREPGYGEKTDCWIKRVLEVAIHRATSLWHSARAAGQLRRFERVAECGKTDRGVLRCSHCQTLALGRDGNPVVLKNRCNAFLLCHDCRQVRKKKHRRNFERGRHAALERVVARRLNPGVAPRDPIAERFITLTCPHIPRDVGLDPGDGITRKGPELQAYVVRKAGRPFLNALRNHFRGHPGFDLVRYVRVLEATQGNDELGHVHTHIWMLSPFVRVHVLRALWGRALIKAGFPLELWPDSAWKEKTDILAELKAAGDNRALSWARHVLSPKCPWPNVDIRRVYSGRDGKVDTRQSDGRVTREPLATELIKYLTKDFESGPDGNILMHPSLFAAVYRGLDAGRMITASLKFWVKHHAECQWCGALDSLRPCELPRHGPGLARGPPGPLFAQNPSPCAEAG